MNETAITCWTCGARFKPNTIIMKVERCKVGDYDIAFYHNAHKHRPENINKLIKQGYTITIGLASQFQNDINGEFGAYLDRIKTNCGRRTKWTPEQEQIMQDLYHKVHVMELSKMLNKTRVAILAKAKRMGLANERM